MIKRCAFQALKTKKGTRCPPILLNFPSSHLLIFPLFMGDGIFRKLGSWEIGKDRKKRIPALFVSR
jgi:hypothetical protein